ncbi:hypothetical protein BpHYR1_051449 [Brachionus plicatilis]|uniref:Uncharacterized protein n=1 Tax=Brachionus plicatilis TaxID=10195 RepID=A0A3M7RFI5_BRAPC|nr:hypothetical protein BpHYR1_051449 [Brachionus plicatilis]
MNLKLQAEKGACTCYNNLSSIRKVISSEIGVLCQFIANITRFFSQLVALFLNTRISPGYVQDLDRIKKI